MLDVGVGLFGLAAVTWLFPLCITLRGVKPPHKGWKSGVAKRFAVLGGFWDFENIFSPSPPGPVPDGSGQALHASALLHLIAETDKSGLSARRSVMILRHGWSRRHARRSSPIPDCHPGDATVSRSQGQ